MSIVFIKLCHKILKKQSVHVLGRRTKIPLIYFIRNLTVNYIDSNVFIVILNPEL